MSLLAIDNVFELCVPNRLRLIRKEVVYPEEYAACQADITDVIDGVGVVSLCQEIMQRE